MCSGFQVDLYVADVARALTFHTAISGVETFGNSDADVPDHVEVRLAGAGDPDGNPVHLVMRRT